MTTTTPAAGDRPGLNQAVCGILAPNVAESTLRTVWPSVTDAGSGPAGFGKLLIRSKVLAPFGWLVLAPLYFKKVLPYLAKRYKLTTRRVMIQRGLKPTSSKDALLESIDDVRIVEGTYDNFFRSATLEVISNGQAILTMTGVPEPEAFRQSILNAVMAWVPSKAKALKVIPASAVK